MFRDALLLCCNCVTHTDSETPPGGERRWGEGRGRGGGGLLAVAAAGELKTQLRDGVAVDLAELWNLGGRSVSHASLSGQVGQLQPGKR